MLEFKHSIKNKFKLSLDIHGVIDSLPDFFAFMSESFIQNGGEVHIITGSTWNKELERQLELYGIKWSHYFSIYDHLTKITSPSNGEVVFPDGTRQRKFNDECWDKAKGDYCKINNISLHLDDTTIYNDHFTTPFARFWSHSGCPKLHSKYVRHLV